MSKIIEIPGSSIQRYFPNEKIIRNICNYLSKSCCNDFMIAGGAARYMLSLAEVPSSAEDIDIYIEDSSFDKDNFVESVFSDSAMYIKMYIKSFSWLEPISFPSTDNIQYEIHTLVCRPFFPNIQFIMVWSNLDLLDSNSNFSLNNILNTFDFTVCQAGIYFRNSQLFCKVSETFMEDEKNRVLRLTGRMSDTLISRIYKYIKLGYKLSEESYVHILSYLGDSKDKDEQYLGQLLLTKVRNERKDFIISPYAQELYEKWIKSLR